MATWVRSFSADLTGTANTALSGPADLDTDTIPGDFDAAGVTQVRFQFTLSHTGTFNSGAGADSYSLLGASSIEIETTGGTQLAVISASGTITDGTATVAIDQTDSSPNTGASSGDWSGAQFSGVSSGAITDFTQGKGPDGVTPQILASSATITITYTPGATVVDSGAIALTGSGTLTTTGSNIVIASSTVTGTGTLTTSALVEVLGSANLTGTGTLTTSALLITEGSATLTGTGTLTTTGTLVKEGSATLTGTGTLTSSAFVVVQGSSTLAGTGTVTSSALVIVLGSATVAGTGTLTTTGLLVVQGSATLTGTAAATSSALVFVIGTAPLTSTGTITATGQIFLHVAAASLTSGGALTATAYVVDPTPSQVQGYRLWRMGAGSTARLAIVSLDSVTPYGFLDSGEPISDKFRVPAYRNGDDVMADFGAVWAAHQESSTATALAAFNSQIDTLGYTRL